MRKQYVSGGGVLPYPPCKFNPSGIVCIDKSKCDKCGWNPAVERQRKADIRKKRSVDR